MDYISKYLKYKNKYISLKNKTNLQKAGANNSSVESENLQEFIRLYNSQQTEGKSSLDILYNLGLKIYKNPRNILIGCTNKNDNDYRRFKNNNFYSLYINSYSHVGDEYYSDQLEYDEVIADKLIFDSDKQYFMYTIYKERLLEIINNPADRRFNQENSLLNTIDNIHYDYFTSYFCDSQEYFRIANYLLKQGGVMTFNLFGNHFGTEYEYSYDQSTNLFKNTSYGNVSESELSLDELQRKFNVSIDIEKKDIIFNKSTYINNMLDPQFNLSITYNHGKNMFTNNYDKYIEYLAITYTNFTFEKVMYTFKNYTYPVPIRITDGEISISAYEGPEDIIFNKIMTTGERQTYATEKNISEDFINVLSKRILNDPKYSQFSGQINSILSKPQYYINVTKK